MPHVERCEVLRHCRWVDEVVPDAPWKLEEAFVTAMRIDYVAIDEGVSVDPAYDKERVKGYDMIKSLREFPFYVGFVLPRKSDPKISFQGKAIPTRRTSGLIRSQPSSPPKPEANDVPPSNNGTLRRMPPQLSAPTSDTNGGSPFEEPPVDLFE